MKFFYEHSEFLPYALIILFIIIACLVLRAWCNWCRYMKQYDAIQEKELLKRINEYKKGC